MFKILRNCLLALSVAAIALCGQQPAETVPNPLPPAVAARNAADSIVPSLKGLVFVSKDEDLVKEGVDSAGVRISGLTLLDDGFKENMAAYLDHPLTFGQLDAITHAVVAYYRALNHPLVDATAPVQNVSSGVIQIVVTEFRVGEVRAEGNRWFSNDIVTAPLTVRHGDTVDSQDLINQLDAANTNPFRRVNLVYQPSAEQGYTDLVLQTQDRLPLRVFTGFDNGGTPATGRSRFETGFTWGNALWHDQQLSYQFTSSTDLFNGPSRVAGEPSGALFQGNSLTWSMPVRGRDSLTIFGLYDRSVPNIGTDFGLVGISGQASIRYSLALRRTGSLIHTLQFGYDFKTTNNNLQFGGTSVSRTNAEIDQAPVTYAANLTDKWGSTALTTTLTFSPGHITPNNTNDAFQPGTGQSGRLLASARYAYWRTDATRLTKLPLGNVWALRLLGQTSSSNLLYTEQLAGGGSDILRGYDPNAVLADRGVIISNELRSPSFPRVSEGLLSWLGNAQALGFWDYAHLSAVHDANGALNHISASSAGVGMRYNLRSNLTGRADWGHQLQHIAGTGNRKQLLSFSLIASY